MIDEEILSKKEQEWIKLVREERCFALDSEKRDFLIKIAGIIEISNSFNVKYAYDYYE